MRQPLFQSKRGMEESQEECPSEQPGRNRGKRSREESTPDATLNEKEYDHAIQGLREELELDKQEKIPPKTKSTFLQRCAHVLPHGRQVILPCPKDCLQHWYG